MAEIFATISAAINLADVALRASNKLRDLIYNWKNAPDLIYSLANETVDLNMILSHIQGAEQTIQTHSGATDGTFIASLNNDVQEAQAHLVNLEFIVDDLRQCGYVDIRRKWLMKKSKAVALQTQLNTVRKRINELLITYNL